MVIVRKLGQKLWPSYTLKIFPIRYRTPRMGAGFRAWGSLGFFCKHGVGYLQEELSVGGWGD